MTSLVKTALERGILTVTLDSPQNRNALSLALVEQLDAALVAAAAEPDLRAVVLDHTGPTFCAGADLKEDPANIVPRAARMIDMLEHLATCPVPVVVALKGNVRAGGLGLLGGADIVIAPSTATFAFTEVRLGVAPAIIAVTILPRMDPRAAQRYFLTGEELGAAEAARVGLVTTCVAPEEVDAELARLVAAFRLAAPGALRATKALLHERAPKPVDRAGLTAAAEISARLFLGDEAREGMAAFREKRAAAWVRG